MVCSSACVSSCALYRTDGSAVLSSRPPPKLHVYVSSFTPTAQVRLALSRSCMRHGVRRESSSSHGSLAEQTASLVEALAGADAVRNGLLEKLFMDDPSVDIEAVGVSQAVGKLDKLLNKMHDLRAELRQRGSGSEFASTVGGEWAGQEAEGHRREVATLNQRLSKAREDNDKLLGGEGELQQGRQHLPVLVSA